MARPRTLRDSPRCRVPSLPSGVSASRGHRSLSPRVAHVSLRTPVTVCPHAPRLRSPRPPPLLLPAVCPALSPPTAALSSLLLPDGLASSEPRSVRADGIPGSERSAATATRQRGGRSASRRPGGGERRPPFGRAAERARSAARASPGHPPAHSAPTPLRLILYLHRSILYPRRPLSSLLLPDGLASSEPRSVRADVIPGSERHAAHRHASAGRWSAPRRPGERSALTPFGRAAEPARSAARASPGHPPAHSAPTPLRLILYLHRSILYPRRPLSSLLLPDGLASSEPRSVRADVIPGSERHAAHRHASAGRWSAPRRPGERSALTPFGRAAEPARSAARASPGYPAADSAPALYPRAPLLPPPPAARQKTKKSSADPPGRTTL